MPKPTIESVILLAAEAHRGQTDKAGLPYILHPLRVMSTFLAFEDEAARMVAVLHDIVEDTRIDLAFLKYHDYPADVVNAVDAISRREDETYVEYIERVSQNPLAARVKLADLHDNLDPRRRSTGLMPEIDLRKYRAAVEFLEKARGESDAG